MVDISRAFPSRYLKAADLQGRSITVTIAHVDAARMGGSDKYVAYFHGKQKGLPLNKTNARAIAQIVGSTDTDHWPGGTIVLYPAETDFAGTPVECIRVRAPSRREAAPPPPPRPPAPASRSTWEGDANGDDAAPPRPITDDDIPF